MAQHPDLAAEQAHIDHAYQRLRAMKDAAAEAARAALAHTSGAAHQTPVERDVMVRLSLERLSRLELGGESLCFGRIDRDTGEVFHIGRLAVADVDHEPLVVDWRAPAAEAFYRATGAHPLGLRRRRHFLTRGPRLLDIEDELFGIEGDGNSRVGPSALLAALDRSRSGRMRDIVATVQREQDEIIRAPLAGVLVVQGGPGTGKTAVALHRAAYLLYTHRFPLERQGVLVVGPNRLFLHYIEQVLPSLGENGVELSAIGGLVAGVNGGGTEQSATARLKGDPRMAALLVRAVADRQRPLPRAVVVGFGAYQLRISVAASADMVASARRRPGTHNERRAHVERLLFRRLHRQLKKATERNRRVGLRPEPESGDDGDGEAAPAEALTAEELARRLRRHPGVREALERMWPVLTPAELLHDLFGAPSLLGLAGRGLLAPDEIEALHRPRSPTVDEVRWTPADVALLDEAAALLGPTGRERGAEDDDEGLRSFGHIVVDEAQDLSPMQLRMLGRRSLSGSMTLVGDVAQATGHWAPTTWDDVVAHLPTRQGSRVTTLSVNYRTPAEVMELAGRVLAAALPEAALPSSVRSTGDQPLFVPAPAGDLGGEVARRTAAEATAVGDGTVAVICPPSLLVAVGDALRKAGVDFGDPRHRGLDTTVTLVPLELAKGLEFDSVVVVEPSRLVGESERGLRALYTALTRTTRRLTIVHAEPLPAVLAHQGADA